MIKGAEFLAKKIELGAFLVIKSVAKAPFNSLTTFLKATKGSFSLA